MTMAINSHTHRYLGKNKKVIRLISMDNTLIGISKFTFSNLVILDSLYGMCVLFFLGSPSALITLPSANRPELMWTDSAR